MVDLSNNNVGAIDFERVRRSGQRRVYLKLTEGAGFHDRTHNERRRRAHAAGFLVGEYHFARPSSSTPREEANHFLRYLPDPLVRGRDLRPCLDLEDPRVTPSTRIAAWAQEWLMEVRHASGHIVVVYGTPAYLERCGFRHIPGPLWLASYGRNDGREHPFRIPRPWQHVAAHQFTSVARFAGIKGPVDLSHVYVPAELDIAVTA